MEYMSNLRICTACSSRTSFRSVSVGAKGLVLYSAMSGDALVTAVESSSACLAPLKVMGQLLIGGEVAQTHDGVPKTPTLLLSGDWPSSP